MLQGRCQGSGQCWDSPRSDSELRLQVRPWCPSHLWSVCLWAYPCVIFFLASRGLWPLGGLVVSPWGMVVVCPLPLGRSPCYTNLKRRAGVSCHEKAVESRIPLFATLLTPGGLGAVQANLHKAVRNGLVVHGRGSCLGDHSTETSPKQALVVEGDGVGMLCQHICWWPWTHVPTLRLVPGGCRVHCGQS